MIDMDPKSYKRPRKSPPKKPGSRQHKTLIADHDDDDDDDDYDDDDDDDYGPKFKFRRQN